ncbi:MAG: hypothetical protein JST59_29420 [Actinobacteria bacterium]|nr:hypothetical protein [Actinomycetota bacterium]
MDKGILFDDRKRGLDRVDLAAKPLDEFDFLRPPLMRTASPKNGLRTSILPLQRLASITNTLLGATAMWS